MVLFLMSSHFLLDVGSSFNDLGVFACGNVSKTLHQLIEDQTPKAVLNQSCAHELPKADLEPKRLRAGAQHHLGEARLSPVSSHH